MKKILLAAICIAGIHSLSFAQEGTSSEDFQKPVKRNLYVALGAAVNGDYAINEKLAAVGMPQLGETMPEFTVGYTAMGEKFLVDFEVNANVQLRKRGDGRASTLSSSVKLRGHYVPVKTNSFFLSAGADVSYLTNTIDLYNRYNTIDLNNLDPLNNSGHINLYNNLLYAGPSVSLGLFQNTDFPVRLNAGYEWALTNGYWKSEFADVYNSVKESGHDRFYAKVIFML